MPRCPRPTTRRNSARWPPIDSGTHREWVARDRGRADRQTVTSKMLPDPDGLRGRWPVHQPLVAERRRGAGPRGETAVQCSRRDLFAPDMPDGKTITRTNIALAIRVR